MESKPVEMHPMDEHNRALIGNVHPADYVNPEPTGKYNLVVIGAGTAGLVTAVGAAGLGAKVALIERHLMGGDCLNVGCVPSKGLISAARRWAAVRDASDFGIRVPEGADVDFPAVMERMRRLRARIAPNDSVERYSQEFGVDVFLGDGRFVDSSTVEVAGKKLRFAKAVVATGGRANVPTIPGLAEAGYLTNETVFALTELPPRLAVIGAGPIGCELAQSFRRFGSRITLVHSSGHILSREDPDAAAVVEAAFVKDGVDLALNASVVDVKARGDEKIVRIGSGGEDREVLADEILVGVGRSPNVEGLGLEKVGVDFDKFGVKVDDHLQTTNPRIFAAGDVCSKFKFTHAADFLARIVIQNALFPAFGKRKASALTIPSCTYTDPEVAHVGLYEKDAADGGIPIQTYAQPFEDVDRAILDGEEDGLVKVHVRAGTDKIVGATIVASHAGEMISELSVAMVNGIGLGKIAKVIHPYPTQAEAIRRVGDQYNRTRLTPTVKRVMQQLLKWGRA